MAPVGDAGGPTHGLLRLQSWLSPAFPIGGFSYSHGLEQAIDAGWIAGRDGLIDWLDADLRHGSLRSDAVLCVRAYRDSSDGDAAALLDTARLAGALRGSAELALESTQQGRAFLTTVLEVWPSPALADFAAALKKDGTPPTLSVVVGVTVAAHGIPIGTALPLVLQAWVAGLTNAAVRLGLIGQTDGQRVALALEPAVADTAAEALAADREDIGSAALMVDIATLMHETQYTRLFRS